MSVINDVQTNRVCALSIITSYFCLNTAQYIVEYACKARQGKFICIAHFIHIGNSKCFT